MRHTHLLPLIAALLLSGTAYAKGQKLGGLPAAISLSLPANWMWIIRSGEGYNVDGLPVRAPELQTPSDFLVLRRADGSTIDLSWEQTPCPTAENELSEIWTKLVVKGSPGPDQTALRYFRYLPVSYGAVGLRDQGLIAEVAGGGSVPSIPTASVDLKAGARINKLSLAIVSTTWEVSATSQLQQCIADTLRALGEPAAIFKGRFLLGGMLQYGLGDVEIESRNEAKVAKIGVTVDIEASNMTLEGYLWGQLDPTAAGEILTALIGVEPPNPVLAISTLDHGMTRLAVVAYQSQSISKAPDDALDFNQ